MNSNSKSTLKYLLRGGRILVIEEMKRNCSRATLIYVERESGSNSSQKQKLEELGEKG